MRVYHRASNSVDVLVVDLQLPLVKGLSLPELMLLRLSELVLLVDEVLHGLFVLAVLLLGLLIRDTLAALHEGVAGLHLPDGFLLRFLDDLLKALDCALPVSVLDEAIALFLSELVDGVTLVREAVEAGEAIVRLEER